MKWMLFVGSALGHIVASLGLDQLPDRAVSAPATPITIVETPAQPEIAEPEPTPEPELSPEAPQAELAPVTPRPTPASPQASPVTAEAGPPSLAALPDLGLQFAGTSGTGAGLAVASGGGGSRSPTAARVLGSQQPKLAEKLPGCAETGSPKPRLSRFQKPAYSDAARGAGVTGKIRVSITVGPDGQIEAATILQGLGHGLDQATLEAVRAASFEAATRCGIKVRSTFTMSVRFAAE